MAYNNNSSPPRWQGLVPHSQSPDGYATLPYSDPSYNHSTLAYAAVNSASHIPAGPIAHQSAPAQYPYFAYSPDNNRSYYPTSSHGSPKQASNHDQQPEAHGLGNSFPRINCTEINNSNVIGLTIISGRANKIGAVNRNISPGPPFSSQRAPQN